jgi:hypothetical protein
MTQLETRLQMMDFNARGPWLVATMVLMTASTGCGDGAGSAGKACPCTSGTVCCPATNVCAADEASCGSKGGPAAAPTALAFTRRTATAGDFSWAPVAGATSYALYVNGTEATTTITTTAALEIGAGEADVQVVAVNQAGRSPKSGSFPVLFDVSLRACASDTVEARWRTGKDTDTQLSIERAGMNTISCTDPTLRQEHLYGDIASCAQLRTPASTGGVLTAASTMAVNMLSRDELGFLGKYRADLTMPGQSCMCANSSKPLAGGGCNPPPITGPMAPDPSTALPPCGPAFDLETGKLVDDPSLGDIFMEASEDANGSLTEARLVAPGGVAVLKDTAMCDVVTAPSTGYVDKVVVGTATPTSGGGVLNERTTTFVVKTRSGRYAKLSLECNCPGAFLESGAGIGALGMRFGWRVAEAGSMTFKD